MQANEHFYGAGGTFCVLWLGISATAQADLRDPNLLAQLTPLEQRAALANQAVYDRLTIDPDGAGPQAAPCALSADPATSLCANPALQNVFENVRELVHNANQLTGGGPTTFSLGFDAPNLGFALRWTAAEELAAQGASATEFSNNQLSALASRLSALRFGAGGVRVANLSSGDSVLLAGNDSSRRGGGASADDESIASRWSAFVNGSFGFGTRDDSTANNGFEDAFDFDGQELTIGIDHRFNDRVVGGIMGGYSNKTIDFDVAKSIVDASMEISGYSAIVYGLWEQGGWYLNGSFGGQWLDLDTRRRILYPSFNPLVQSVDSTSLSTTRSSAVTATFSVGYEARWQAMTFGPYAKADYQDLTIDGFTEGGSASTGFGFNVASQEIKSLDTAVGLRAQRMFTPSFGVVVPYVRFEWHKELENDQRTVSALYADTAAIVPASDFALLTDAPDDEYSMLAGGLSVVFKHGLQGFLQYHQILGLDRYSDHVISAGVRYEL